jgi:hypothetical protein
VSTPDVIEHGPPYEVGCHCDHSRAVEIAHSAHPSRVLANTYGYRYGLFEEQWDGSVTVTMMGSHIATFLPAGVRLWSCGRVTQTTTEALNALITCGRFYTRKGVIMFADYSQPRTADQPLAEGQMFPYAAGS